VFSVTLENMGILSENTKGNLVKANLVDAVILPLKLFTHFAQPQKLLKIVATPSVVVSCQNHRFSQLQSHRLIK
jgi:hypothetical protein